MISKEQHKFLFKVLNSYKVNRFSTDRIKNPKRIIKTNRRIGNYRFEIFLYKGEITLEVTTYWNTCLLIQYNPNSDNISMIIKNFDLDDVSNVYRLHDVSEILEEDGYFQQSLVQNLPLEYNDFCRMIDEVLSINSMILARFDLTEQEQEND